MYPVQQVFIGISFIEMHFQHSVIRKRFHNISGEFLHFPKIDFLLEIMAKELTHSLIRIFTPGATKLARMGLTTSTMRSKIALPYSSNVSVRGST